MGFGGIYSRRRFLRLKRGRGRGLQSERRGQKIARDISRREITADADPDRTDHGSSLTLRRLSSNKFDTHSALPPFSLISPRVWIEETFHRTIEENFYSRKIERVVLYYHALPTVALLFTYTMISPIILGSISELLDAGREAINFFP